MRTELGNLVEARYDAGLDRRELRRREKVDDFKKTELGKRVKRRTDAGLDKGKLLPREAMFGVDANGAIVVRNIEEQQLADLRVKEKAFKDLKKAGFEKQGVLHGTKDKYEKDPTYKDGARPSAVFSLLESLGYVCKGIFNQAGRSGHLERADGYKRH